MGNTIGVMTAAANRRVIILRNPLLLVAVKPEVVGSNTNLDKSSLTSINKLVSFHIRA